MRVLNVNMTMDPVSGGGTAERTLQISRFIARAGHKCTILSTDAGLTGDYEKSIANQDLEIVTLPCLIKRFYIPPLFSYHLIEKLVMNADIVHLMNHFTLINALVYFAAKRHKKPFVVCPAGSLPSFNRSEFIKKCFDKIVGTSIIQHADACIAISPDEINHFRQYGIEVDRIHIIQNGIDPDEFSEADGNDFRRKHALGNHPLILFLGRLNEIKGPDLLVHAFCRLKDHLKEYHLIIAGPDDGMLSDLKQIISEYNVSDRVHFIGYTGGRDKVCAYHAADLLVIPSRLEAMSIVALEAGIVGTPILMTDPCGFDDVGRVKGGMIVDASIDGIREGLLEILKNPADLKKMGANLKQLALDRFLWKYIAQQYLNLYDRILQN